jgi:hypothetical protein
MEFVTAGRINSVVHLRDSAAIERLFSEAELTLVK